MTPILFGLMLFACFIPFQIVLIPMARMLGLMGLAGTTWGLALVHVVYGIGFTTLYFRNYYAVFPSELVSAAQIDGAGFFQIFWRIMLPSSGPIAVVSIIWQFTNIWNDFLFGASFAGANSQPMTVALNNLVQASHGVKEYNVHFAGRHSSRNTNPARLHRCGPLLCTRSHGGLCKGIRSLDFLISATQQSPMALWKCCIRSTSQSKKGNFLSL